MKGHHAVKTFDIGADEVALPEGWKPFAALPAPYPRVVRIVARKWVRGE